MLRCEKFSRDGALGKTLVGRTNHCVTTANHGLKARFTTTMRVQTMEELFLPIEEMIITEVNRRGGLALWNEVMTQLELNGPCGVNGSHRGYASGFFVERLKTRGEIKVHQVAPRAPKYLVTRIHPGF